ncbi:MAG: Gfo/Idh/MocA family oxidoreductase [Lachnospiraceae bacterium]|nr:Gfo/Idh/MocA family oxidoreductase [Lachnospiraceae bacterium]
MDKKKVKIGVFGGARGFTMISQLLDHPDAELVAVCDKFTPLLDRVRETAKSYGVEVALYDDFDEFLKHDMDAVVLANYANEHGVYSVRCLEAGKHVMSEVLPVETPAQAVALVEAVERTGLVYTYAENYCYMKAPFEMFRRYRKGDIGEIIYAEGEYIHDCSSIWPDITYGEKDHWRNRMFASFYCTHSCGPLIYISGLRAVKVVGLEPLPNTTPKQCEVGMIGGTALEMITLENGAVIKSIHGGLKREPGSINYQVYGTTGMMESARYNEAEFNIYREGDKYCQGTWEKYMPENDVGSNIASKSDGHGGSDFYTTHCFIEKILGNPDGELAIDVYTAVNMGMCGIMAFRSILDGNTPKEIPDFRKKEERDRYRYDNACCTPSVAGDSLLPPSSFPIPEIPDETYENVRKQWLREDNPIKYRF